MDKEELQSRENIIKENISDKEYLIASKNIWNLIKKLNYINKNGIYSKKIIKLKKELIDVNQKATRDFKTIRIEVPIDENQLKNFMEPFYQANSLDKQFMLFSHHFLVKQEEVKNIPVSLAQQLCSVSTYDEWWNIVKWSTENISHVFAYQYNIALRTKLTLLSIVLLSLIEKKDITPENICEQFNNRWLFHSSDSREKTLIGLKYFMKEEYLASMSILIPNFEDIIINLLWRLGWDKIKINRPPKGKNELSTEDKWLSGGTLDTLWEFLHIDVIYQLKFILIEKQWMNLRNIFAHWKNTIAGSNKQENIAIILLYILVSSNVEPKNK